MKSRTELCDLLRLVTYRVIAESPAGLSAGSGVIINEAGWLLTAKHVVGSKPDDRERTITVCGVDRSLQVTYLPIPESFVRIDSGIPTLMRPLNIDLVLLRPETCVQDVPFVELRDDIPRAGTDVIMAGFSDDVYPTFNWDEAFETCNPDMAAAKEAFDSRIRYFMRQLLCKRAMIGNVGRVNIEFADGKLVGATYTLDAELTHGGSGGPVVDYDGRLVGIICRKGLTTAKNFEIQTTKIERLAKLPSTTGFALSHKLLINSAPRRPPSPAA